MITETVNPLPEVILTERAAQVFKEACEAEGSSLGDTFLRIGARPGGCSGWKYELESSTREEIGPLFLPLFKSFTGVKDSPQPH